MFKNFKTQLQDNFATLISGHSQLYIADVDKDVLWEAYLAAYPEAERQSHNCNSCRQFIKNYGNVVVISDNRTGSIWNFEASSGIAIQF